MYQDVVRFSNFDGTFPKGKDALFLLAVRELLFIGGVPALAGVVLVGTHPWRTGRKPSIGRGVPLWTSVRSCVPNTRKTKRWEKTCK